MVSFTKNVISFFSINSCLLFSDEFSKILYSLRAASSGGNANVHTPVSVCILMQLKPDHFTVTQFNDK